MATLTVNIDKPPIPTGNTLWVDAVNGNNTTALRGRQDRPYLTLNAAKAEWTSGDEIRVRPGTYNERVMFGSCDWHLELGAVLDYNGTSTGNAFGDNLEEPATGKVTGWGVFRHSGLTDILNPVDGQGPYNAVVGTINQSSDWYFECLRIEGRQQQNVGSGGLVIDSGKFTFLVREELSSTIYDALLNSAEVTGECVTSGYIHRIYVSALADHAIEFISGAAVANFRVGSIVSDATNLDSINGLGRNVTLECDSIVGGGVRVLAGTIIGANITMNSNKGKKLIKTMAFTTTQIVIAT